MVVEPVRFRLMLLNFFNQSKFYCMDITLGFENSEKAIAMMNCFNNIMVARLLDFNAFTKENSITIYDIPENDWTTKEVWSALEQSQKSIANL